jgi:hypothetical protein
MHSRVLGRLIVKRVVQPAKAFDPMCLSPSGRVTVFKWVQPSQRLGPMTLVPGRKIKCSTVFTPRPVNARPLRTTQPGWGDPGPTTSVFMLVVVTDRQIVLYCYNKSILYTGNLTRD